MNPALYNHQLLLGPQEENDDTMMKMAMGDESEGEFPTAIDDSLSEKEKFSQMLAEEALQKQQTNKKISEIFQQKNDDARRGK
jgi:hypothetical protein